VEPRVVTRRIFSPVEHSTCRRIQNAEPIMAPDDDALLVQESDRHETTNT